MADAPTAAQTDRTAAFGGDRQARAALSAWLLDGAEIIRRCRVDNNYDRTYCREQITEIAMIALRSFDSYRGAQADGLEYKALRLWVEREIAEAAARCAPEKCPSCKREFKNGDTCHMGGCPMGGDF